MLPRGGILHTCAPGGQAAAAHRLTEPPEVILHGQRPKRQDDARPLLLPHGRRCPHEEGPPQGPAVPTKPPPKLPEKQLQDLLRMAPKAQSWDLPGRGGSFWNAFTVARSSVLGALWARRHVAARLVLLWGCACLQRVSKNSSGPSSEPDCVTAPFSISLQTAASLGWCVCLAETWGPREVGLGSHFQAAQEGLFSRLCTGLMLRLRLERGMAETPPGAWCGMHLITFFAMFFTTFWDQ